LTRSAAAFESAERRLEGRRKFTKLSTFANRSNSDLHSVVKLFLLILLSYILFLHLFDSCFQQQNIYILQRNATQEIKSSGVYWTLENKTLSKRPFLRSYHTTRSNETMPTSVPKGSALGVCKQCQVNDAVENVRSRPMCR
jgi:hypothetical protein